MALADALPAPEPRGGWRALFAFGDSRALGAIMLLAPAVLFFLVVFVVPVGLMIRYSFYQQTTDRRPHRRPRRWRTTCGSPRSISTAPWC